ncbi:hypothetical protein FB451DRAFT_1389557 [Mycena latifolia]|nr:hypothetical protein FB451DRAFT_1389557 [Mycena latifolia]
MNSDARPRPPCGYGAIEFSPTTLPAHLAVPFASTSISGGLLSPARGAILGLPDLVIRVCAECEHTGPATPFVFSALAPRCKKGERRQPRTCGTGGTTVLHPIRLHPPATAGAAELDMVCAEEVALGFLVFLLVPLFFEPRRTLHSEPGVDGSRAPALVGARTHTATRAQVSRAPIDIMSSVSCALHPGAHSILPSALLSSAWASTIP